MKRNSEYWAYGVPKYEATGPKLAKECVHILAEQNLPFIWYGRNVHQYEYTIFLGQNLSKKSLEASET